MKFLFILLVQVFISLVSFCQLKPLILKGKLDNCSEKEIFIFYESQENPIRDTIKINPDGTFYYKTYKCKVPQKTSLQRNSTQINDLFIAPGYDMTITGDAKDSKILYNTVKITGIGSQVNRYRDEIKSYYTSHKYPDIYALDSTDLKILIKQQDKAIDSLLNIVFNGNKEPYADEIKKIEKLNNTYLQYYYVFENAYYRKYDYKTYTGFISNNIPKTILDHPSKDEYLYSIANYRSWFLSDYNDYLQQRANRKDSSIIKKDKDFLLKEIARVYTGKVRSYIFNRKYISSIEFSKNIEDLTASRKTYSPFLIAYVPTAKRQEAQKTFAKKYNFFLNTKVGMLATNFTLPDTNGINHSLSDFLGKVVYIDFWASWCAPCRAETPVLKEVYKKYGNDPRLKILGVAVFDGKVNWMRALKQDQPDWLQLRDGEGKASSTYKTNTIPRYAIIDKKGKIVSIDAPQPSNKALIALLEAELKKQ